MSNYKSIGERMQEELDKLNNLSEEERKQLEIERLRRSPCKERLLEILEGYDCEYKENAIKLVRNWCLGMAFNDTESGVNNFVFFILRKGFDRDKYPLRMIQEIEQLIEDAVQTMLRKSVAVHFAISQQW